MVCFDPTNIERSGQRNSLTSSWYNVSIAFRISANDVQSMPCTPIWAMQRRHTWCTFTMIPQMAVVALLNLLVFVNLRAFAIYSNRNGSICCLFMPVVHTIQYSMAVNCKWPLWQSASLFVQSRWQRHQQYYTILCNAMVFSTSWCGAKRKCLNSTPKCAGGWFDVQKMRKLLIGCRQSESTAQWIKWFNICLLRTRCSSRKCLFQSRSERTNNSKQEYWHLNSVDIDVCVCVAMRLCSPLRSPNLWKELIAAWYRYSHRIFFFCFMPAEELDSKNHEFELNTTLNGLINQNLV